jgi:hypothetical protein
LSSLGGRPFHRSFEDGIEVDEERVGALPCEDRLAGLQPVHGIVRGRRVVRDGQRADVARAQGSFSASTVCLPCSSTLVTE